ncbi:MAG: site-2 protease family protein [Acidobacteria bacterium]|nr:site-2 protease family protein [Acidobacteriota bacterium]MCB9397257.1 site-2 protease family protein [Acidobacteriota bacterium]
MSFDPAELIVWSCVFILSTTVHEASHAWTALKLGDPTAYHGGQVSLNPWPHIKREPIGMVIIPLLSFALAGFMIGYASAPIDAYWSDRYPHRSAKVSLAGPFSNLALCLVSTGIFILVAPHVDTSAPTSLPYVLAHFAQVFMFINLLLFTFNLLPLYPLDGHEGILLFFPENKAHQIRSGMRSMGMIGLLIAWLLFNKIFPVIVHFYSSLIGYPLY